MGGAGRHSPPWRLPAIIVAASGPACTPQTLYCPRSLARPHYDEDDGDDDDADADDDGDDGGDTDDTGGDDDVDDGV